MKRFQIGAQSLLSPALPILFGMAIVVILTLATPGIADERAEDGPSKASAGGGALRGSVTLGPRLMARKMRFSLYPDLSGVAPPAAQPAAEIRNVVIYLSSPALDALRSTEPSRTFRMEQRNESFVPHVLPVMKGSTVEFPNGDPIYHNVFSLSRVASFDLGRYPRGASRSIRFDEPGVVKVFCHIHSDMSGVVLVLDNPFFTAPGPEGSFDFPDLPPGEYTVTAWHERARPVRRQVVIQAGRTSSVDFAIPLEDVPVSD
ncbi:MAG TPA: carboxypeptidase regulatory-like domain-containing protein [Thermoanaerobaculia bacterium]|nr:carboxypeptidase regulatory-like domain-containing protein [Thermoanaerobaculia bacterium]